MDINQNGCTFCNEFNGKKELSFFDNTFGEDAGIADRIVFETADFVCVPSIGSFTEGYLLLIPRKHFLSMLSIPSSGLSKLEEAICLVKEYHRNELNKNTIVFEHGASLSGDYGGMSVIHAHQHLVPYDELLFPKVSEYNFTEFKDIYEINNHLASNRIDTPYFFFQDIDGKSYISFSEDIPSQFFRHKLCDLMGLPGKGNWKVYPFVEKMRATIISAKKYGLN